jgi:hypothetical protein
MKKDKLLLLICWLGMLQFVFAQADAFKLSVVPVYAGKTIQLTEPLVVNETNGLQLDVVRFYISNIRFVKHKTVVYVEPDSYHLVDAASAKPAEWLINTGAIEYDSILFDLGIDSSTNVAGVKGEDLDPTKGMYWSWQSGYINCKLEGKSNQCTTRNHEFELHLGGYMFPFANSQTVSFANPHSNAAELQLDLQQVFSKIDLSAQHHIMSPSIEAVKLSSEIAHSFKLIAK